MRLELGAEQPVRAVGSGVHEQVEAAVGIQPRQTLAMGDEELAVHGEQAEDIAHALGESLEVCAGALQWIAGLEFVHAVERAEVKATLVPAPDIRRARRGTVAGVEDADRAREIQARGARIEAEPKAALAVLAQAEDHVVGEARVPVEDAQPLSVRRDEHEALAARGEGEAAVGQALTAVETGGSGDGIERSVLAENVAGAEVDIEDAGETHRHAEPLAVEGQWHQDPVVGYLRCLADRQEVAVLVAPKARTAAVYVKMRPEHEEVGPPPIAIRPDAHLAVLPARDPAGTREKGGALELDGGKGASARLEFLRQFGHQRRVGPLRIGLPFEVTDLVVAARPDAAVAADAKIVDVRGRRGMMRPPHAVEFERAALVAQEHVPLGREGHAEDLRMAHVIGRPIVRQDRPARLRVKPPRRVRGAGRHRHGQPDVQA